MASNQNPSQQNPRKSDEDENSTKGSRPGSGFGSMDPQRQREIAAQGGRAAHASGNAHEFTSEEAARAGAKGGAASHGGQGQQGGNQKDKGATQGGQAAQQRNQDPKSTTRGDAPDQHAQAGRQGNKNP